MGLRGTRGTQQAPMLQPLSQMTVRRTWTNHLQLLAADRGSRVAKRTSAALERVAWPASASPLVSSVGHSAAHAWPARAGVVAGLISRAVGSKCFALPRIRTVRTASVPDVVLLAIA